MLKVLEMLLMTSLVLAGNEYQMELMEENLNESTFSVDELCVAHDQQSHHEAFNNNTDGNVQVSGPADAPNLQPKMQNFSEPPQLQSDVRNLQQIVALGHNVTVRCPVLNAVDFVVWKHNTKELQFSLRRKTSNKGWLKIVRVSKGDAGRYTCQAVNGFGSVEANITLIVHDPNAESKKISQQDNFYPESDAVFDTKDKLAKPTFLETSRFPYEIIQRPAGSNVRLKCLVDGSPKPKIYWLKDGKKLSRTDLKSNSSFMSRWCLHLMKMRESDSGLYTCIGQNEHGIVNKTFTLEVIGRIDAKPELMGTEPVNITVFVGNTATFRCRVKSAVPPHIKIKVDKNDKKLLFENASYRILASGEAVLHQGSYLNKLQLVNVQESDTSKYICMAVNVQGYSLGEFYLRVLPRLQQAPPPITTIVVSVVFVLLVAILLCLLYRHVRKSERLQKPMDEHVTDDTSTWLKQDSASQAAASTSSQSVSHFHQHHHQHHHFRCKN